MPLFTFKCTKCEDETEKFLHSFTEETEVLCEKCEGTCERIFSMCKNRVELNAKDLYSQQIVPDAKRMMDNMKKGQDKDFFDVYGDE